MLLADAERDGVRAAEFEFFGARAGGFDIDEALGADGDLRAAEFGGGDGGDGAIGQREQETLLILLLHFFEHALVLNEYRHLIF